MADEANEIVALSGVELINSLDKDGLELYARANFGRELDKRRKLEVLREEVKLLETGDTQRAERAEAKAKAKAENPGTPKTVRHVGNGRTFQWNPQYAGNADLEIIEWE